MKILWFTNTPCGAIEIINKNYFLGGWLKSLEDSLVKNDQIELSVCFYWNTPHLPFKHKYTTYYPIYRHTSNNKIVRHVRKYFPKNDDKREIPLLIQVINTVKPDVIHIHGTEENFGLIQEFTKIPCVISIQGLLSVCAVKYYDGIPKTIVNKNESLFTKLKYRPIDITHNILKSNSLREQRILFKSNYIIGRTNWDNRITKLLAPNSHYYIVNEMLRPVFYEKQWRKNNLSGTINIVTVISDPLYKGLETVAQVAGLLLSNKSVDFRWQVIGINEKHPVAKVVKRWLQVRYTDLNIELIGNKNEEELLEFLINADIYCQCSHIENSSNSLCEAMITGMPIVASYAGGTDSMLENNKEGILVQAGDYYSFAGAIKSLIDYPERALYFGNNARKTALARHNSETIVKELIDVYQTIKKN